MTTCVVCARTELDERSSNAFQRAQAAALGERWDGKGVSHAIAVFDTHGYDRASFDAENGEFGHDIIFLEPRLTRETAPLAQGS